MSNHPTPYTTEGKAAALARKNFRREVAAGRASWADRRPAATTEVMPEVAGYGGEPMATERVPSTRRATGKRSFGEGLGARCPSYRLPGDVTSEDLTFWEAENAREMDREIDRMAAVAAFEAKYDGWY